MRVNRDIRAWTLDNWLKLLEKRPSNWHANIPKDELERINECLLLITYYWNDKKSPAVVKALLLKGAQVIIKMPMA